MNYIQADENKQKGEKKKKGKVKDVLLLIFLSSDNLGEGRSQPKKWVWDWGEAPVRNERSPAS